MQSEKRALQFSDRPLTCHVTDRSYHFSRLHMFQMTFVHVELREPILCSILYKVVILCFLIILHRPTRDVLHFHGTDVRTLARFQARCVNCVSTISFLFGTKIVL